jgi:alpha-L-fucosidase
MYPFTPHPETMSFPAPRGRLALAAVLAFAFATFRPDVRAQVAASANLSVPAVETPVQPADRLAWWREARLGLFIHWGVYSLAAGEWRGEKFASIPPWTGKPFTEFFMLQARIPVADYETFARDFNPVRFDADAWARTARAAGLRYLVFTAKHHDGFALYHSACDRFNLVDHTPFKRDPLRELADACARHGLKLGIYYSLGRDWHDPDVPTNWPTRAGRSNSWDFPDEDAKVFSRYFQRKVLPQVRELLTNYGPVGVLWFDTPELISQAESRELLGLVRQLQPDCIVNDRIGHQLGDFATSEQKIPDAANLRPWEACLTLGRNWGYNRYDDAWKSPEQVVCLLTDTVAKGGNFLINVGPRPEGDFPAESLPRLAALGRWLDVNAAAIHGTRPWLHHGESATPAKPAAKPAAGQTAPDADTVFDATPKGLEPDLRFTCDSAGAIYVIARGWHAPIVSASYLGLKAPGAPRVASVTLLGSVTAPTWRQTDAALEISFPASRPGEIPVWVFKVVPATSLSSPAL